jgi:hypothetical protein
LAKKTIWWASEIDEADAAGQQVDGADAAVDDAAAALANVIMDVTCREHRSAAVPDLGFVEAAADTALAVGQLPSYSSFHSKSLLASGVGGVSLPS